MLNAAPVDRRQLRQWQCTVCSAETLTCSTTDPQAQEAARGVAGAAASTRGRGSLLAGEIADDEAAITTATAVLRIVRCICFCCGPARKLLAPAAPATCTGNFDQCLETGAAPARWAALWGRIWAGLASSSARGRPAALPVDQSVQLYRTSLVCTLRKRDLGRIQKTHTLLWVRVRLDAAAELALSTALQASRGVDGSKMNP